MAHSVRSQSSENDTLPTEEDLARRPFRTTDTGWVLRDFTPGLTLLVRAAFYLPTTALCLVWAVTIDPAYWWALLFPIVSAGFGRLLWDPVPHEIELLDDRLVVRRLLQDPVAIPVDAIRRVDLATGSLRLRDETFTEKLPLTVCRLYTAAGLVRYAGPLAGHLATLVTAERPDLEVTATSIDRFGRPGSGLDVGMAIHYRTHEIGPVVVALAQIVLAGGALYLALTGLR